MITLNGIKKFADTKNPCSTYFEPFKRAIRNKDKKLAWQIVAMNVGWLNDHNFEIKTDNIPIDVDGEVYLLNRKGVILVSSNIKNGKINGKHILYRDDGSKGLIKHYKDNVLDGDHKHYYRNGNIFKSSFYKDGFLHGECIEYYVDGLVKMITTYEYGKINGEKRIYFEDGKIYQILHFKNGIKDGERIIFDNDGSKVDRFNYKDGLLEGDHYHYVNGNIESITNYFNDKKVYTNLIYYHEE